MTPQSPLFQDSAGTTTPLGLLRYALEFFAAAHATNDAIGDDLGHEMHAPMVVNFLVGQALELALKAYLLDQGLSVAQLRRSYGHDLVTLFDDAREKGFGGDRLRPSDRAILGLLNGPYKARDLQYFTAGTKPAFPVFEPLNGVACAVLRAAVDAIPHAHLLERRKASAWLHRFGERPR